MIASDAAGSVLPPTSGIGDDDHDLRVVSLGRGHGLIIRPLRDDDRAGIDALFAELPADDVRLRFFNGARPTKRLIDRWFDDAGDARGRLVAIEDGVLVGDAGWYRLDDDDAEFDITVKAHHRGWLGPFLLDAVVEHAKDHGIRNLIAEVDWSNAPMLAVLRERGYVTLGHDGARVLLVAVGAEAPVPLWHRHRTSRARIVVEGPTLPWDADRIAATYGAELLACHVGAVPGRNRCPALIGDRCPLAAEADDVVVALPERDERAAELLEAHRRRHPEVARFVSGWSSAPDPDVGIIDRVDVAGIEGVLVGAGVPVDLVRRSTR